MTHTTTASLIECRPFTTEDLSAAHELSRRVQWPHRLEDWEFVLQLGQGFVAEEDGEIAGTALYWKYGSRHASLGMIIVAPDKQGRGIGKKLMSLVLAQLKGRTIVLNSTVAGRPLYEQLGFFPIDGVQQFQGTVFQPPAAFLAPGERLRPLGASDGPKLANLATRASGMPRTAVMQALLEVADGIAVDRDDKTIGFALIRRFGRGYAIGPVVAPDVAHARALIGHLVGSRAGAFVRIDVPESCGLSEWLTDIGLQRVDTVVTMMSGPPLQRDATTRLFALVNQALG